MTTPTTLLLNSLEVKILQSIWTENEVGPYYYKLKKLSAWAGEADQLVSELDVSG